MTLACCKRAFGLFGIAAVLGLAACGPIYLAPTGYAKADPILGSRYGYSDKPIGADEYSVVVHGNPGTGKQRAAEIALLRAAYLTQEQGRTHFTVLQQLARESDATVLIAAPVLPLPVFVPVAEKETREPVAVLVIRLLPTDAVPTPSALEADHVIRVLKQLVQ